MEKIDGLTPRQILVKGTTQGVGSLTNAQYENYTLQIENQSKGVPNYSKSPRKYARGGEVRGMGAAVSGTKFKGVF